MKAIVLSALALTMAAPMAAHAKPYQAHANTSINHRQVHQDQRIAQGVRSGSLTRQEISRLARADHRIAATEARMRADNGGLSRTERMRLQKALDRQSKAIYVQKHDNSERPPVRR